MSLSFADAANSQLAWLQALVPAITSTAPVISALVGATASVDAEVYGYLDATAGNAFLSTATGSALVALAADRGVQAGTGTPSTASLTLALSGLQPAGYSYGPDKLFSTAGDALTLPIQFAPTATTAVAPGDTAVTLTVQSTTVGTATNVGAGTITTMVVRDPYVTNVTNGAPATGGTDPQSDASLLVAAQAALAPPGTVAQMQKAAVSVPNIATAVVVDLQDSLGGVNVYALDISNTLTGATTTPAVPTTGEALTILNAVLPTGSPGLTIQVARLAIVTVNVTLNSVTQVPGSGLTAGMVQTAVETFIDSLQPGQAYVPSQLLQYLFQTAFPGQLLDVEPSSMAQTTVTATQIAKHGTIVVSAGP